MIIRKLIGKYRLWRFAHALPKERGRMLHEGYVGDTKVGKDCEIFTKNIPFGSEPYLVEIGDHVRITDGVKFCTHDGGLWVLRESEAFRNADYFGRIIVENNVHIGWNSIIMPGVTIGHDSVIGCGAVVTKDIPPYSVAVGVPARVVKTIEEYKKSKEETVVFTKNFSKAKKREFLCEKYKITG